MGRPYGAPKLTNVLMGSATPMLKIVTTSAGTLSHAWEVGIVLI